LLARRTIAVGWTVGLFGIILIQFLGCAGKQSAGPPKTGGDNWSIQVEQPGVMPPRDSTRARKPAETAPLTKQVVTEGFRVQIFTSSTAGRARLIADEAKYILNEKTYVQGEKDKFKVFVGDCSTREEAEKLRDRCRNSGYKDAFIVRSRISPRESP